MPDNGFLNIRIPAVQSTTQDDDLVMGLVELALAQPPEEREPYLRSACASDSQLFVEVWEYVSAEQRMNGFLLDPLYPPLEAEQPFEIGELLEGRFRIVREVAEGGMGVVYEAVDERLDRRIAIKAAKSQHRKRLPPEVRHASEISHPNVCKIFEIHTAATDRGDMDFITMEFLDGETLKQRLRRGGPLPEKEARSIARQLCAGLAAAHRNHVIHGDLKSNNVVLTTAVDGAVRAVITDFGLARRPETMHETVQSGAAGGTPEYMAPELWKGAQASAASDIYALGVIFYEMISGRRPVDAIVSRAETDTLSSRTPSKAAVTWEDRLTRKPPPIHPKWDRVLGRCLDPNPARRFATADELAAALAPGSRRWVLTAAVAAVMAAISGVVSYERATAPTQSWTLALVPVESSSADLASLAANLSGKVAAQLARIHGGRVAHLSFIPPGAVQDRRRATHLLRVTIRRERANLILRAVLSGEGSSGVLKDWTVLYAPGEERYAPVALAGMVTGTLRLPPLAFATVNATALKYYQEGVEETRRNSTLERAVPALQRAVEADSDSPLTHAALAEAEWFKYYDTKDQLWADRATDSLRLAQARDPDTASAHRVAGYLYYRAGLYGNAQAELTRAIQLQPGNATAHIWLGKAYEDNNQFERALTEFQTATRVEPKYFRTYQNLGAYYQNRSNFGEAARSFRAALVLAPDEPGLQGLLAAPCMELGWFAQAEHHLRVSLNQHETVGADYRLGQILMYEKNDNEAMQVFQKAFDLLDGGASPGGTSRPLILMYLGIAYRRAGLVPKAEEANRIGLKLAKEERNRNFLDGYVNAFLAYFDAALGNRDAAEEEVDRATNLFRDNADVRWRATLTYEELYRRFHDNALRDATLRVLGNAKGPELADLNRWPDLADLQQDQRFITLVSSHPIEDGGDTCAQ